MAFFFASKESFRFSDFIQVHYHQLFQGNAGKCFGDFLFDNFPDIMGNARRRSGAAVRSAETMHRMQRSFKASDDLIQCNICWFTGQFVSAMSAAFGMNEIGIF